MKIKACLTNNSDLWKTPKQIYDFWVKQNNWFDPCPTNPKFDGLKISWKKTNFVNPPYSQIEKWVDKAIYEAKINKCETLLLIPARTDTKWFRKLYEAGAEFEFIQGRLKFNDSNPAPFPSMFVSINQHSRTYEPQVSLIVKEQRYWEK